MKLDQPLTVAVGRAFGAVGLYCIVPPSGQALKRCEGHGFINGAPCLTLGASIVTDAPEWPEAMPMTLWERMAVPCWLKTRRTKERTAEYLITLHERRDRIITGYRNHARFEAAAHLHLCVEPAGSLDVECSCPPEVRDWFAAAVQGDLQHMPFVVADAYGSLIP